MIRSYFRRIVLFGAFPLVFFTLLGASAYFIASEPADGQFIAPVLFSVALVMTIIYFGFMTSIQLSVFRKNRLQTTIDPKLMTQLFRANENLIVTLNDDFTIAWTNDFETLKKLMKLSFRAQVAGKHIDHLLGSTITKKLTKSYLRREPFSKTGDNINRNYLVSSIDKGLLVFQPNDLAEKMKKHFFRNRTVFWILELDDQTSLALSSPRFEQNKSEILASVTIALNENFRALNGVVLSLTKGEFLILISQSTLETLVKNSFAMIEAIKKNIASKYDLEVSFSGGIYSDDNPIFNSEKNLDFYSFSHYPAMSKALNAKQFAQSRGGNLIVVKTSKGQKIFGKQDVPTKSMPVRLDIYKSFTKKLSNYKKVLIVGHRNPDLDVFGAAIGLKKFIDLYSGSKIKSQVVSTSIAPTTANEVKELIQEKNYSQNVVTKFNFEKWFATNERKLVILVDTGNPDFLDFPFGLVGKNDVAVFDHHNTQISTSNTVFNYSTLEASSASELILGFLIEWSQEKKKEWPLYVSQILLAGILSDTNNLQSNIGQYTLGIINHFQGDNRLKIQKIIDQIKRFKVEREKTYKLSIGSFKKKSLTPDLMVFTRAIKGNSQFQAAATAEEIATKNFPKSVIVILAGSEHVPSNVYVSIRSQNEVNAGTIAEQLGGGGDAQRAAAQLSKTTITKTLMKIEQIVDKELKK